MGGEDPNQVSAMVAMRSLKKRRGEESSGGMDKVAAATDFFLYSQHIIFLHNSRGKKNIFCLSPNVTSHNLNQVKL